jgi:hypothetical protein
MVNRNRDKQLSPKQTRFIEAYANPTSKSFGNASKSYTVAGYEATTSLSQCACRLLASAKIKQAIELYTPQILVKRAEINREYAFNKWQELYDRCLVDHDNTNCVALMRMVWQQQGLLDNKLVINLDDSRRLEEGHREAARRIGAHLLETGILDAEFEPIPQLNPGNDDSSDNTVDSSE